MRDWDSEGFFIVAVVVGGVGVILYEIGASFGALAAVVVFLLGLLAYQAIRHESRTFDARRELERAKRSCEEAEAKTHSDGDKE
jgi:threonine/homoserine/homoserine lactone efflux protein